MRHARRCLLTAALALSTAGSVAGCASMSDETRWSMERFFSNPGYVDLTEVEDEEWVTEVGATGRKNQAVEKANDPLGLRQIFMSEKARSIERNVGIE